MHQESGIKPSITDIHRKMFRELGRIPAIGALGIGGIIIGGIVFEEKTVAVKNLLIGVGAASCAAVTYELVALSRLYHKAMRLSSQANSDVAGTLKPLTRNIPLDVAEQINAMSRDSRRRLTIGSEFRVHPSGINDKNLATQSLAITLAERNESLADTLKNILPGSFTALTALRQLPQLFPVTTTEHGGFLTPSQKDALVSVIELLPLIPPDQHASSDAMIAYYQELIPLYQQITYSYLHQVREDSLSADRTASWEGLSQAIRAEQITGRLTSPPLQDHERARYLHRLKENRFLITGEDAVRTAKQLVAMYFRAIPAVKSSARDAISFLKNEYANSKNHAGPDERKHLEYIGAILDLTSHWSELWNPGTGITDQNLSELFGRLQAAERYGSHEQFTPADNSPRGRIRYHSVRGDVTGGLNMCDPEKTSYTIEYQSAQYLFAEETAICISLIFPGIKFLRFSNEFKTVEIRMDEFYREVIVNKNRNFLRSCLTSAAAATKGPTFSLNYENRN